MGGLYRDSTFYRDLSIENIAEGLSNQIYDGEVDSFPALPAFGDVQGQTYLVETSTGIWPTNNPAGLYYAGPSGWVYLGVTPPEVQTQINISSTADRDRANHTGTQLANTISNFNEVALGLANTTWISYASQWDSEPVLNKSIAGGDVYNYVYNGVTRYRFVPSTYDPTQDCFYTTFNSGTDALSGLIICRGL